MSKSWSQVVDEAWKAIRDTYHDTWKANEEKYEKFRVKVGETYELPDGSSLFEGGYAKTGLIFSTIRSMIPRISTKDAWITVKPDSPGDASIDWQVYEIAVNKSLRMVDAGSEIKKAQLDTLLMGTGFIRLNAPMLNDYMYPEDMIPKGGNLDKALPGPDNPVFVPASEEEVRAAGNIDEVTLGVIPDEYISRTRPDYRKTLPKISRVSPYHVVWPKNCTDLDKAAWVAHIIPTTLNDLKEDTRYDNSKLNGIAVGDDGDSPTLGDGGEVKKTFDRTRGEKIVYKAEIFIRKDPYSKKQSGKIIHVVLGHDRVLYEIENPYKDKIVPLFQLQFNPLNDKVVGVSEVDAITHDAARLAALETAMFRNFARFHAQKLLVGNGASIVESEERKLLSDDAGAVVKIDGSVENVKFSQHLQIPQDWMLYREQLRRNAHEGAGLDAFMRGSAVKDISASQSAIIDKSSSARIEEKHAQVQKFFGKFLEPYGDILTSFVDDIFIDVSNGAVDMSRYKDLSFIYSIDPMSLKPTSSPDEIISKIQFLKVVSQNETMLQYIDLEALLKHLAYSMSVPIDVVIKAYQQEPDQAGINLAMLEQAQTGNDPRINQNVPQFGPGDRAEKAGTPGNNNNPLASALSAANGIR